jgi:hypothetical protein
MATADGSGTQVTAGSAGEKTSSGWGQITVEVLVLVGILAVLLLAFALPAINTKARHVPIAVVAPAQIATAISQGLDNASPDGFDVTVAADTTEARNLILDRSVYGAFIVGQSGLTVETASAASYVVSTALTAAGQQIGVALSAPVTVTDVVSFSTDDPRGVGLSAGALPIALGGWIAAVAIIFTVRGRWRRLIAAAAFAVVGGFTLTAVLQYGLGTFTGNYLLTSLGAVLGIAATSFLVLGFYELFKYVGVAIAAVILIVLGNPLSGLASAPEMLPEPWGALGQLLPPGAIGTLLRNVAFFDGAATTTPIVFLSFWFLAGLGMYLVAVYRSDHNARSTA